ncbi:MAG: 2-C-methyl-D-erythritol 2,4-cyclodiphosphate synthase [Candidatus Acididesulfobacter guangdongensis]|uniref:2-C-methyl-D-erythritol 2,4-cyclodiphosphate synthase n=1 Tax=Acididesulfobacter guangdongensis TaxID=2597225 RepID=A0A519BFA2_ACIG2|nr:MAG: 2-C-methyl-D-erythritol 2,4-cyclodiphosphate synthase [Candidatus Acididesulfobacter guangdongensis]
MTTLKIGHGYDIHKFDLTPKNKHINKDVIDIGFDKNNKLFLKIKQKNNSKPLYLGGILIENHCGTVAHSDGDVILHSLTDALLGAAGLDDIGTLFPDNIESTKNISSVFMLQEAHKMIQNKGYCIINIDITVITQTPKIKVYKDKMILAISEALNIQQSCINIKGKTKEGMDSVGRGEAIECFSVCLINNNKII